ncbi:MAG: site-2 protease family protein [Erysipelotrichales bacterium]|nr:site-2 protease family protein [Erysipelotrichales bacterium]
MLTIISIFAFLFILGLIIMFHEVGHFLFAKRAGILCHEFALGMGPVVYKKRKGETTYSIRAVPFGGFVAMAGEGLGEYIRVGQEIGLNLKDGLIEEIILSYGKKAQISGTVHDFDLYGQKDGKLFITLKTDNGLITYECLENARFIFSQKDPIQISPYRRCFESKSKTNRFLAIVMGPVMNFILAFLLFTIYTLFVGVPNLDSTRISRVSDLSGNDNIIFRNDEIKSVEGIEVNSWQDFTDIMRTVTTQQHIDMQVNRNGEVVDVILNNIIFINSVGIGSSYQNSNQAKLGHAFGRAQQAGIRAGMIVSAIEYQNNGNLITVPIDNFTSLALEFQKFDIMLVTFIMEDGQRFTVETFGNQVLNNQDIRKIDSRIGVSPSYQFSLTATLTAGFRGIFDTARQIFRTLGLVFGRNQQVTVGDLSGPVGIFVMIRSSVSQGFWHTLRFTAFMSVNVGIINLLPIPALDGGRLVFLGVEAATGKKPNKNFENLLHMIVFFVLIGFMIFVTFRDIGRFF